MSWNMPPRHTGAPLLEHCPIIFSDSSDEEEQSVTDGFAPEFAKARRIERRVQRLMRDLKARHAFVEKEHRELVELKNIARQVFTAIYMCKAELDEATEDNDWETVKRVRNVMAVCQKAVKGYSGGELWELEGMEEDK